MGKNTNPMVFASTSCTGSVFSSAPLMVEEIVLKCVSTTVSVHLVDMALNDVIHYVGTSVGTQLLTSTPKLFPNGLRVSTSCSTAIEGEGAKLFIWVR